MSDKYTSANYIPSENLNEIISGLTKSIEEYKPFVKFHSCDDLVLDNLNRALSYFCDMLKASINVEKYRAGSK